MFFSVLLAAVDVLDAGHVLIAVKGIWVDPLVLLGRMLQLFQ